MAIDLTSTLSGVKDIVRNLRPDYEGAILVLLRKNRSLQRTAGAGAWERYPGGTILAGWDYTSIRLAQTSPRLEVLVIYGDSAAPEVINGAWPAFDIVKADGSFDRFTKGAKVKVSGFSRKYVFQVTPNTEDQSPTPPEV